VLLDHFLNCAIEVDIDAVCVRTDVVIGAINASNIETEPRRALR